VTSLKRLTLVVDDQRVIRGTLFPIRDVTGGVEDALVPVHLLRPAWVSCQNFTAIRA
jgi:hypothetical protein